MYASQHVDHWGKKKKEQPPKKPQKPTAKPDLMKVHLGMQKQDWV